MRFELLFCSQGVPAARQGAESRCRDWNRLIKNDQRFLPQSTNRGCFGAHRGSMGCLIVSLCLEPLDVSSRVPCVCEGVPCWARAGSVGVQAQQAAGSVPAPAIATAGPDPQLCVTAQGKIQGKYLEELKTSLRHWVCAGSSPSRSAPLCLSPTFLCSLSFCLPARCSPLTSAVPHCKQLPLPAPLLDQHHPWAAPSIDLLHPGSGAARSDPFLGWRHQCPPRGHVLPRNCFSRSSSLLLQLHD